jgi:membrane fusion protein (multidrug efflux system)
MTNTQRIFPMQSRSLRAVRATLAIVTLGVVVAACGKKTEAAATAAIPEVVIGPELTTIVVETSITSGPSISGSLVADKTAQIRAEVGGRVTAVLVEPGARVAKDAPLARVDDSAVREAMLGAKSGVTQAQLGADIAKRDLERAERLLAAGAVAENAVENARRGNLGAQAALEDAKARLANAQRTLDNTVLKAPYEGIVSERMVNAGDIVAPGAPMFTVVDPSTMRLEGSVPADQLGAVRLGATVKFGVTGYPGKSFSGTISNIYPSADPQTKQVRLYARIPNAGSGLVAGLFANGRVASTSHSALAVPQNAVDQRGIKPYVLRLKNGKAEKVEVTIGVRDDETENVEVLTGLAKGDTVLVGRAQGITVGAPVKVNAPSDKPSAKN